MATLARTNPDPETKTLSFDDDGVVPNNPDLPVVLIHGAVHSDAGEAAIRALYERNGWHETWTATVFDYQHYHPDAHEALTVASGWADLLIGGKSGTTLRVHAGDAIVLPAGVGHRRIDQSDDFAICGAYPADQPAGTIVRAPEGREDRHIEQIAALSRPASDPIFGDGGPLTILWGA